MPKVVKCPKCGANFDLTPSRYNPKTHEATCPQGHTFSLRGGKEVKKPTAKELMTGRVLDGYVEASRVKTLEKFSQGGHTLSTTSPAREEYYRPQAENLLAKHSCMYAVWVTLDLDRTLTLSGKNSLWQDFVAAWNRRGLLSNEEALLLKLRFSFHSSKV